MDHPERPRKPKLNPGVGWPLPREQCRQRFLEILRQVGGTLGRNYLRERIHPGFRALAFEEIAAELVAEGLVEVEKTMASHLAFQGYVVPHTVTLYQLTKRGWDLGSE